MRAATPRFLLPISAAPGVVGLPVSWLLLLLAGVLLPSGCTAGTGPVDGARKGLKAPTAAGEAHGDTQSDLAHLSAESREAVRRAPVPVLLFPDPWAKASIVTAGPRWYAISAREGELTLVLHASDTVHHTLPDRVPPPQHAVRGQPARVTVNETVRSVAWQEGDVFYVVEAECYRGDKDPRCSAPAFVLEVANSLVEVSP